ncbi:MAG: hypothetical protein IJ677_01535 [Alphaproteobacteria bacterium]|nr:hypothetical protein [Alphaproteobacteria bacterium]
MEIERAYYHLMINRPKYSYVKASGKVVSKCGFSWIVVFESMSRHNYAVVKFYNGIHSVIEM